jgi:PPP family 3-phenylpropionic acid transporter
MRVTVDRRMLPAKSFYFFYYAAAAALAPFLVLYYEQLGLNGRQIGVLTGMLPLVTLFSAPVWGGAADARNRHRSALSLAIVGTMAAVLVLSTARTFLALIPVIIAYAIFVAPIAPLADNTVLAMLGPRTSEYGRHRLWGAVGWGLSAPLVGELTERAGLQWMFYVYVPVLFLALLVARRLPLEEAPLRQPFWRNLRVMLANRRLVLLLATVFTGGASLGLVGNYLFLYMDGLGANNTLMGLALTMATISEMVILFFSSHLLASRSARGLLAVGLLACVVRTFAYSVVSTPWVILLVQLLHGPAFALMWAAGVYTADRLAPQGMGATAQGLLASVMIGLGNAAGGFFGGLLYDLVGPVAMFRWTAAAVLAASFVLLASDRRARRFAPARSEIRP